MVSSFLMFLCILCIHSSFPLLLAQQSYIGKYFTNCKITNNTSSVLGYSCNGRPTCPAYLVFRSRSPYESVASVSHLLTSDPSLLSQLNSVSRTATFPNNKEIIAPVECACSGDSVPSISQRIGVEPQSIVDANELSGDGQYLFPFTTLLIPLNNRPRIAPSPPPPSPPPPPPPSFSASGKISRKRRWVLVVSGCSTGVLVLLVSFIIFYIFYRGKSGKVDQTTAAVKRENFVNPHHKLVNPEELLAGVADVCCTLRDYQFEELQLATENFSTTRAIRGTLYQGILDGNAFVIKKVDADASKEISLLSRLNHFNIFRLLGFSVNQGQCYLVFEYAEKGLLTDWIHDKSESKFLSWTQRVQIAMDVSNGLNYLHNYIEPGQVHMDVTSSGVFLNSDLRAKIANFETVKLAEGGEGRYALTRHITGSKGYMAPEYLEHGLVSANVDVYAFGVVMLETVSGKKAVIVGERRDVFLAEAFIDFMSEEEALGERTEDFIDPFLHGKYPLDLAMLIFKLIGSCLSRDPENRPSMVEIVQVLSKILDASLTWEQSVCGYEIQIVNGPAGYAN